MAATQLTNRKTTMKHRTNTSTRGWPALTGGIIAVTLLMSMTTVPLPAQNSPSPDDPWPPAQKQGWFTIGPVLRGGMKLKVTGSSYAQTLGLDGLGNPAAYGDRNYDDGYVMGDSSAGGGIEPDTTWNWGYNNAVQHDAAGTLAFEKQGVPRYSALAGGGRGGEEDMLGAGLRLQAGVPLKSGQKWSVDLVFSFQGIWASDSYRESASYVTVRDAYDVSGISPFPVAGHRGTFDGPFDPAATPPYTVIPNLPATRNELPFAAAAGAQSSISLEVDQGLYQFSLGTQIGVAVNDRLRLHLTPAISLNIVDVSVRRSETFMFGDGSGTQQWRDSADELVTRLGVSAVGGVDYELGKGWFAGVFGGYEWVPDKTKINIGPNTVSLDASGWVAGLTLGKQF